MKVELYRVWERWGRWGGKVYRWAAVVRSTTAPWDIVTSECGFRTKTGARLWAWRWVRART